MLYVFRTVLAHHQEQLYKLYIAFGICQYVWLLCGYSHKNFVHLVGLYTYCTELNFIIFLGILYKVRCNKVKRGKNQNSTLFKYSTFDNCTAIWQ